MLPECAVHCDEEAIYNVVNPCMMMGSKRSYERNLIQKLMKTVSQTSAAEVKFISRFLIYYIAI